MKAPSYFKLGSLIMCLCSVAGTGLADSKTVCFRDAQQKNTVCLGNAKDVQNRELAQAETDWGTCRTNCLLGPAELGTSCREKCETKYNNDKTAANLHKSDADMRCSAVVNEDTQKCPPSGFCDVNADCQDTSPGFYCESGRCVANCSTCGDLNADNSSPIIIDYKAEGFHLTNATNGVFFALKPAAAKSRIAWTSASYSNAWLVLDRNGNGKIDDLTELFGNATPQAASATPNGYLALAVFDQKPNGGNGNGMIDPGDSVFNRLRLWVDKNHDGVSQVGELFPLIVGGVFALD